MHVLSIKESSSLLAVLSGNEHQVLETVWDRFEAEFPTQSSRLRASCALGILLSDRSIGLSATQRLFAIFCLFPRKDPCENQVEHPYDDLLVELVMDDELGSLLERELVYQWLVEGNTSAQKESLDSFAKRVESLPDVRLNWVESRLQNIHQGNKLSEAIMCDNSGVNCFTKAAVGRAVVDPGTGPMFRSPLGSNADIPTLLPTKIGVAGFEPVFARPSPPMMPPMNEELFWFNPSTPRELVWDSRMGGGVAKDTQVHKLITQALEGPLMPSQQKQVLHELLMEPKLAYSSGLTPESLPKLVENTPAIAYEILLRLTNSNLINDYLQVLARMNMSLHSMEVVNRLASAVNLPEEFVNCYISNCIASCNNVEDRYMKSRLVRLVCVFLQSLIKNGIINMQDLVHEVQAFCIDHSRIREAASLFRLLKQMEMGTSSTNPEGDATSDTQI